MTDSPAAVQASQFEELFRPSSINSMLLKNRLVMVPMGSKQCTPDGFVTQQLIDHYSARARGGVGLVIVEVSSIDLKVGQTSPCMVGIDNDTHLDGLSRLSDAIHESGAKAAIQIHHGGRMARWGQPIAPSPVPLSPSRPVPREMTSADIENTVAQFARAANRAARAGFDGIEIHGAHHYLVAQFLSRASNKRQDEWGGDLQCRARYMQEVIRAVRREVGKGYPVWIRFSAVEYGLEQGITLDETAQFARLAELAGSDAVSISQWGVGRHVEKLCPHKPGEMVPLAGTVKKSVSIPVIVVGRMGPALGVRAIREGQADLIGLGRGLLADPEYPMKVASGKLREVRPCTGCQECWSGEGLPALRCTVNPSVGQDQAMEIRPSETARQVLVVGGGPAGMEAARVAALRGHHVSLWERNGALGGQLLAADKSPGKNHFRAFRNYLVHQMDLLGVRVTLNKEATAGNVIREDPDAVILSTGPVPCDPSIPGLDRTHAARAIDVLSGNETFGRKCVVVGAERVGCEVACFLAERGAKVTVTRRGPKIATHVSGMMRKSLTERMSDLGVQVLIGVSYVEATGRALVVKTENGDMVSLECDTLVLATPCQPNVALSRSLDSRFAVYPAGDCVRPLNLMEAVREGYLAGLAV